MEANKFRFTTRPQSSKL